MRLPTISPLGRKHDNKYNRILQQAYPDCRMRWSERSETWLLERRSNFQRVEPNPSNYPAEAIDTFIQHRDGYYKAGEYGPRNLPQVDKLVQYLRANDPDLMDLGPGDAVERAARLAQAIEDRENEGLSKLRKDNTFKETGMGAELYHQLAWDEGRRVAVPTNASGLGN